MNYIAEIKAFQDMVQIKQLSTGQIALWYALMYINNKCAWIEWFTAPNLTLELNAGLSRSGIQKARNVLKQHGFIDFKANGTRATSYRLISIVNSNQVSNQVKSDMSDSTQDSNQDSNQGGNQDSTQGSNQDSNQVGGTLTKLNETKLNKTKQTSSSDISKIANSFEQNGLGTINITVKESLIELLEVYSVEWILEAIKIAVESNKRSLRYVKGILENWNRAGGMKTGGKEDGKNHNESKQGAGVPSKFAEDIAERAGVTSL